jgi:Arc/MetJ-type ribon-helix-helix transcriptional regulator
MTIDLPKDLQRFVHDAVRSGHYAREDDVIRDALTRLKQALPKVTQPKKKPLTVAEIHQQMLARGLITRLPDPAQDIDDDDPDDLPVPIEGEPMSETIIRERR